MFDLAAALKTAKPGDTIKLPAGTYANLWFGDLSFAPPVTITSADAAHPAILNNFNIERCAGLTFQGLDFQVLVPAYVALNVYTSQAITFDRVHFYGPPGPPDETAQALTFFSCANVAVTNCEIEQLAKGPTFTDTHGVTVLGNHIHHMMSDALDFAQVSDVKIAGNALGDFYPTNGAHADAIQFMTFGTTTPSRDIVISDNLIYRGGGTNTQGIFFGDELETMAAFNTTISNNVIVGTSTSAIRPTHNVGLVVTGNELVSLIGADPTNILVQNSDQMTVSGNSAAQISVLAKDGNSNIVLGANAANQPVTPAQADARVKAWLAGHPGPWSVVAPVPAPVPVPAPKPVKVDPRDAQIASLKVQVASLKAKIAAGKAALT